MTGALLPMAEIETDRLLLRGWKKSDFDMVATVFNDEDNARFIGGQKARWESWRHFAAILGHWHLRGFTPFVVEERETRKTLGFVGPWYPEGWNEPEIGYSLVPSAGGKGFGTEAAIASLKHVYAELNWPTAISMIAKENEGSKRVARKMGATFESNSRLFNKFDAEIWRHLPPQEFLERFA